MFRIDMIKKWTFLHVAYDCISSSWFTLILSWKPLLNLFFKCCGDPRHLHLPLTSTVSWVHNASHSSMLCDVSKIDLPESRDWTMTFHRFRFVAGSMPADGSSNKITFKCPIIARHVLNFRLLPPLHNCAWRKTSRTFNSISLKFTVSHCCSNVCASAYLNWLTRLSMCWMKSKLRAQSST